MKKAGLEITQLLLYLQFDKTKIGFSFYRHSCLEDYNHKDKNLETLPFDFVFIDKSEETAFVY